MGRGNTCVHGNYEGLYYVDWDNFPCEYEDEDGNTITDYDLQGEEFKNSLRMFVKDFLKICKSFSKCDCWIGREAHAILENKLFYIAIEDNEWSIAIKLLQKDNSYIDNIAGLQAGLYKHYLDAIKKCLFNQFETLGVYGGAWTSGTITR